MRKARKEKRVGTIRPPFLEIARAYKWKTVEYMLIIMISLHNAMTAVLTTPPPPPGVPANRNENTHYPKKKFRSTPLIFVPWYFPSSPTGITVRTELHPSREEKQKTHYMKRTKARKRQVQIESRRFVRESGRRVGILEV